MTMIASPASRLRSFFTGSGICNHQQLVRLLSSPAVAAAAASCSINRRVNFFESEPESRKISVNNQSVKFTRPPALNKSSLRPHLFNSASFIGTLDLPPKTIAVKSGRFGVYAVLRVSMDSKPLKILLKFWNELGEVAAEHLKVGDFIYVSGSLGSYEKLYWDGTYKICYQVEVRELNYVKQHDSQENVLKVDESESAYGGRILHVTPCLNMQMMSLIGFLFSP